MHLMQDTVLLDTLLAGVFKAANPRVPFNFLAADWLLPPSQSDEENQLLASVLALRQFPLFILMHIKVYLVFNY